MWLAASGPSSLSGDHFSLFFPLSPLYPSPLKNPFSLTLTHPRNPRYCATSASHCSNGTVSKTAIQRIAEKLKSLGYVEELNDSEPQCTGPGSPGEIFIPRLENLAKIRVGSTLDKSWSTPENPVPEPGSGSAISRFHVLRKEAKKNAVKGERGSAPSLAELRIPEAELQRLRSIGICLEKKLIVGKPGVTEGIVNGIHERWRRSELVKIKCQDLSMVNMKRTHEILETKTGGIVICRSGSIIILYRGANYTYPYFVAGEDLSENEDIHEVSFKSSVVYGSGSNEENKTNSLPRVGGISAVEATQITGRSIVLGVGSPNKVRFQLPGERQLDKEADRLLDGLGPRFTDWWGYGPLPVDADLLPATVSGYRKPFRLLPYGVKPKLTDSEMTTLRRLGRPLPCHFALGRNRNLQGLATSIVRLWEKCEIAKIAVKRGVQNTNSELMAEELKRLTGGTLLSRDREFIVFYRGKDFLPPAVSSAIEERRTVDVLRKQLKGNRNLDLSSQASLGYDVRLVKTTSDAELQDLNNQDEEKLSKDQLKPMKVNVAMKRLDWKLSEALEKKQMAERKLAELESKAELSKPDIDKEGITEEERYMLRKVGLRMKAFLLLGRRGVFDGTIENMHLHWKYRELIKIISKDRSIAEVHHAARTLEAESGGILVSVETVNKGHAIIVYRGKNYQRPDNLRPQNLLNKREAMKHSLEAQRRESLKLHVLKLDRIIDRMKLQMAKDDRVVASPHSTRYLGSSNCELGNTEHTLGSLDYSNHFKDMENGDASQGPLHSSSSDDEDVVTPSNGVRWSTSYADDAQVLTPSHGKQVVVKRHFPRDFEKSPKDVSSSKTVVSRSCSCVSQDEAEERLELEPDFHTEDIMLHNKPALATTEGEPLLPPMIEPTGLSSKAPLGNTSSSKPLDKRVSSIGVETSFKAQSLSNKERLILRKQALTMKKRPVLAIGRNNIVTGVAEAIKTHFKKNPLAIVNVKGRAKGTSVQEVVFKLEQATGAVLVSQEPNKVILYRGWGLGDQNSGTVSKTSKRSINGGKALGRSGNGFVGVKDASPQLLAAMRLECGLISNEE
ncbi:hypothetical protein AMTRI_Chr10g227940 [Amborella trichopoda]